MRREHLREAARGERRLGGDVERWSAEAVGRGQLHGEEEGEEELRLASPALARHLGHVPHRHSTAERRVECVVERTNS